MKALTASASRTRNYYQRFGHFDIRVRAVSFFTYNGIHIRRIAFGETVLVGFDSALFQLVDELGDSR